MKVAYFKASTSQCEEQKKKSGGARTVDSVQRLRSRCAREFLGKLDEQKIAHSSQVCSSGGELCNSK